VWREADKYRVPRIAFVNKMDRVGSDFDRVVRDIREKLDANAWPILIPIGCEDQLRGQYDVLNRKAILYTPDDEWGSTYHIEDVPEEDASMVDEAFEGLRDQLVDLDEELGNRFLEELPITREDLKAALRRQTIAGTIVPVAGGSAFKNKGVQATLDAVTDYLPSPLEVRPARGLDPNDETRTVEARADDFGPACCLAFKLWSDKYVGKLVFFRLYSGVIRKGDQLYNPRTRRKDRVGRIIQIQADQQTDIDAVYSGDIAAMAGAKNIVTGDTLASPGFDIMLEPPTFPEPVMSIAVEPRTTADQEKMATALQRLAEEDPTFVVQTDEETGQTIISGMGELHLEVIRDRMQREFKVESNTGKPQIAYRETIKAEAGGEGKLVKQSGGRGQYGHVILEVSPRERGHGLTKENKVFGAAIPREFINACMNGIGEGVLNGVVAGYPVVDLHVDLLDGSSHDVDSSEAAFKMAAIFAMKDALKKAKSVLLEPVMAVEVTTPEEYQGDILGDLNRRRGQIQAIETQGNVNRIKAEVPLAEMFGYSTAVRTLSSGRASYSMEPSHFEEVPASLAQEIAEQRAAGY